MSTQPFPGSALGNRLLRRDTGEGPTDAPGEHRRRIIRPRGPAGRRSHGSHREFEESLKDPLRVFGFGRALLEVLEA